MKLSRVVLCAALFVCSGIPGGCVPSSEPQVPTATLTRGIDRVVSALVAVEREQGLDAIRRASTEADAKAALSDLETLWEPVWLSLYELEQGRTPSQVAEVLQTASAAVRALAASFPQDRVAAVALAIASALEVASKVAEATLTQSGVEPREPVTRLLEDMRDAWRLERATRWPPR